MALTKFFPAAATPWKAGALWLSWNVIGGLLPLWGTALILLLFGRPFEYYDLLKNGEFVLYAASFIGGGMYTIRRDIFPYKNAFNVIFSVVLALSTLIFAAVAIKGLGDAKGIPIISPGFLTHISSWTLAVSIVLCFFLTVADENGSGFDIPERMKRDEKALGQSFDDLLKVQEEKQAKENG